VSAGAQLAGQEENLLVRLGPLAFGTYLPSVVAHRLRSELEPFIEFRAAPSAATPLLELALRLEPGDAAWPSVRDGTRVPVDTSLYAHLASDGLRFPVAGGYVVRIERTGTHVFFNDCGRRVVVHQPDPDLLVLDGARTVKSLFTSLVESSGGVQLHSAAVTLDDGRAVLLLGDMWQGKTTLLLELLSGFRVRQLSCDTVVLLPGADGGLSVHGWPSPFSISHGTLSDHPELAPFFPEDRRHVPYDRLWREGKKAVLTSAEVVRRFSTTITPVASGLAHCVIVRFRPDGPVGLTRVTDTDDVISTVRNVYLGSRDPIYHDWHGYVAVDDEAVDRNIEEMSRRLLRSCPVTVMTWAPGPTSVLKRIPDLGRAHRHLGTLLTAFSTVDDDGEDDSARSRA
jgi:hypothetical protein